MTSVTNVLDLSPKEKSGALCSLVGEHLQYLSLSPVIFIPPPAFFPPKCIIILCFECVFLFENLVCVHLQYDMFEMPKEWSRIIGLKWSCIPYWPLILFCFSCLYVSVDIWCCNVGKKENVKSCIIYEICIKEKCNSIINKILIQFLEPVVQLRFLLCLVLTTSWLMCFIADVYKQQLLKVLTAFSRSPWPPARLGLQLFRYRTSFEIDLCGKTIHIYAWSNIMVAIVC